MNSRDLFLKEIARIFKEEKKSAARQLLGTEPALVHRESLERVGQALRKEKVKRADLEDALGRLYYGLLHTVLVALDGGTALADKGVHIQLVDQKGKSLGGGLHEYLPEYLNLA